MPKINMDATFVRGAVCPDGRGKVDYYDNAITGFILEVRSTGGKTYALRYRDPRGKQRQVKIGDSKSISFDKARQAAEKIRSRVVLGENPAGEKKTLRSVPKLADFCRETYIPFLHTYRRNLKSDISLINNHVLPKFGECYLDEIKQQEIMDTYQTMRTAGYALATCNKLIVQMSYMFNVAKKAKVSGAEVNPATGIKVLNPNNGRERYLNQDELLRLRDALERSANSQLKYIVALLLLLACRKRELLDAKWENFDLERRSWRIPLSKSGKTRHVPLSNAAISILGMLQKWEGCPYVIPNPETKLPFTGLFVSWDTARKRASLPEVRMHDLRHTAASTLIAGNVPIYTVSKILGHSQLKMTSRYCHLSDHSLLAAVDSVANTVGGNLTQSKLLPL